MIDFRMKAIDGLREEIKVLAARLDLYKQTLAELEREGGEENATSSKSAPPDSKQFSTSLSEAIISIVDSAKGESVTIPTLLEKLKTIGLSTTRGSLSVALSRLKEKGSIVTAGRGKYARP